LNWYVLLHFSCMDKYFRLLLLLLLLLLNLSLFLLLHLLLLTHIQVIDLLIENNTPVNHANKFGHTAFTYACSAGNSDIGMTVCYVLLSGIVCYYLILSVVICFRLYSVCTITICSLYLNIKLYKRESIYKNDNRFYNNILYIL